MNHLIEKRIFVKPGAKKWGIKDDFMLHRVGGDYMRILVNDLMHICDENIFPKSFFFVLGSTEYSKLDNVKFSLVRLQSTTILKSLMKMGLLEEYKGDNKLFSKRMATEGNKAIDSRRFSTAFSLFYLSLFEDGSFYTKESDDVPFNLCENDSPCPIPNDIDRFNPNSFEHDDDLIDLDDLGSDSLSENRTEDQDFGSMSHTAANISRPVSLDLQYSFDDESLIEEAIEAHEPSRPSERTTNQASGTTTTVPVDGVAATTNSTRKRGRKAQSEFLVDTESFDELSLLFVELNVLLKLLHSIDVVKRHVSSTSTGESDILKFYDDVLERLQLFSEREKCEFVKEAFRLPLHCVRHMLESWEDFGSFSDFNCMEMERAGKFIKSLVKPNGNVTRTLNKRIPFSCFLKFFRIFQSKRAGNLQQYEIAKCAPSDVIRKRKSEIDEFKKMFNDQGNVSIRFPSWIKTRGTKIWLKSGRNYAKWRQQDGRWKFIKITRILHFKSKNNQALMIECTEVDILKTWYRRENSFYEVCVQSKVIEKPNSSHQKWIDDEAIIFGVSVLHDFEDSLFDTRPSFEDLIKFI
ncbi:hypothetical protein CANINC_003105 [Pichia inconspicua]|uniref:Uncharacterized protein n=1 Tax=Pichia inconspicua TaxID=52247 RepID=A0A4V4NFJ2_9ASCO|nr:hypothetical protein CANINC_003105 [[Candida] inconspicua]